MACNFIYERAWDNRYLLAVYTDDGEHRMFYRDEKKDVTHSFRDTPEVFFRMGAWLENSYLHHSYAVLQIPASVPHRSSLRFLRYGQETMIQWSDMFWKTTMWFPRDETLRLSRGFIKTSLYR